MSLPVVASNTGGIKQQVEMENLYLFNIDDKMVENKIIKINE